MKKHPFSYIISAVALLFLLSFGASASNVYVNHASGLLGGLFSEAYAIGSSGVELLAFDDVYVLTGSGLSTVSSLSNTEGGGGLLYTDGSVKITSDTIKVGLSFNFNRGNMDTTVSSATFQNTNGSGFALGYYDSDRCFVEISRIEDNTISVFEELDCDGYLGVYNNEGTLLYDTTYPNTKDNLIAIHPLAADAAVTRYSYIDHEGEYGGNLRYFGDFEVGYTAGEGFTVINTVDIETYIKGVIAVEMPAGSPLEAYKAQAVAARTYAQRLIKNTDLYSYYGFDLTNNTYYQAYYGYYYSASSNYATISQAVEQTRGQYLTYNGNLINAMYGAANGGQTVDGGQPYLKSFEDPYEGKVWTKGMYGHGIGLSQWGAYSMAKYYNKDYLSILGFYYTRVGLSNGYL